VKHKPILQAQENHPARAAIFHWKQGHYCLRASQIACESRHGRVGSGGASIQFNWAAQQLLHSHEVRKSDAQVKSDLALGSYQYRKLSPAHVALLFWLLWDRVAIDTVAWPAPDTILKSLSLLVPCLCPAQLRRSTILCGSAFPTNQYFGSSIGSLNTCLRRHDFRPVLVGHARHGPVPPTVA